MKALILVAIAAVGTATAQTATPVVDPATQLAATVRGVSANTVVDIAIDAALNSKTSKIDEFFPIRLLSPVRDAADEIVIPAGTMGQGQVVHAAKARATGKAGEMILAARYLQCGDTRIPLGHFKFATTGEDKTQMVTIASAALSPVFMFVSGGEVTVPVGARAKARITAEVAMTVEASTSCLGSRQGEKGKP